MPGIAPLRFRQVHLDFHTSPLIPDVGREFDVDKFGDTFAEAHVDSVTVFGKCHHGMCYYPSSVGPMHPSLQFDLLGAQIEALHKRDIRAPIYLTCVWDNYQAEQHPEWQQRRLDGTLVGAKPGEVGWRWICLNSPYLDYQEAQTNEMLDRYEVDGLFYDIVFQANELAGREGDGCCCEWCLASMRKLNLNPENAEDQLAHAQIVIDRFMDRLSSHIRARKRDATIFYNGRVQQGMGRELRHFTHTEIEALPTGGWGYAFYPQWVRYARQLGRPTMGMTGRFHRTWADFGGLKTPAALKYECGSMLANGSVCSIGDQLHPRGALDAAVYEVIGEAYADVAAKEAWCSGAEPVSEIALLIVDEPARRQTRDDSIEGAAKMLLELHQQFDILDAEADWSGYRALVVADRGRPTPESAARLREYLRGGGALLLSNEALLDTSTGDFALAEEMGVHYVGPCASKPSFFRVREQLRAGIRDFPWVLMGGGSEVRPSPDTAVLADVYASYFNRTPEHFTSHGYSPRTDPTGVPAATLNGRVAYLYGPFFADYQTQGDPVYRKLVGKALRCLFEPMVTTEAPPSTEVTLMRQGERHILHLVNYQPNRRGGHIEVIEEVVQLRDVRVSVALPYRPARVYCAPSREPVEFEYRDGRIELNVPRVAEHAMVVLEP